MGKFKKNKFLHPSSFIYTVGQNGDFADIRGYLKGTKCCRGSWQLVLTYERDKSNGSQKALKLLYSGGLIL